MKRLSFASEVLTDPPLMFCDEPTSGLDSFMAQNVVSVLKVMANKGKTVVITIHQPSSEVFSLFDKVLLMAEGHVTFLGTTDEACTFFKQMGAACPSNYNPADYFIELLAVIPTREDSCKQTIELICDNFQNSEIGLKIHHDTEPRTDLQMKEMVMGGWMDLGSSWKVSDSKRSPYKASWCAQMRAVLWRSWLATVKEPVLIKVRVLQTVIPKAQLNKPKKNPKRQTWNQEKMAESLSMLAVCNNIPNQFKKGVAGRSWLDHFLSCHKQQLSLRRPTGTSYAHAEGFTKEMVLLFFDLLESEYEKNRYEADRIWDVDETGLSVVQSKLPQAIGLKLVGLLIGVIYYGQELNQDGVMNINGAIFILITNMTFQNVLAVINEQDLVLRMLVVAVGLINSAMALRMVEGAGAARDSRADFKPRKREGQGAKDRETHKNGRREIRRVDTNEKEGGTWNRHIPVREPARARLNGQALEVFCAELSVFKREHFNGMYRTDVYFLCKTIAEIPVFIAIPVIFISTSYYMIGLNPGSERFMMAVIIFTLVSNVATSFSYFISCVSSNVDMALTIGPVVIIPFLLFGGFFLNNSSVPIYFKWLSYLSWFKYANEALLINQWGGVEHIDCTASNTTCPKNGLVVIENLSLSFGNFDMDLLCLAGLIIGFRFLAYLALLSRTYRSY
uniref:Uncharacterized protein n=1 Tax=Timema tahoe TaxID=61484 RepID=A0A7R9IL82_9NEOP|nr:unnamed protein product [Timema tahoe]